MTKTLLIALTLLLTSAPLHGQSLYNYDDGLAVQGYDVVSYFTKSKAVEGDKKYTAQYHGGTYRFSTPENLAAFKKNPAKYEPSYGGWCAYSYGTDGSNAKIDPETFKVKDGRLYLFYNFYFTNTLPKWNEDEASLMKSADKFWSDRSSK